jgi:hypothetical protein
MMVMLISNVMMNVMLMMVRMAMARVMLCFLGIPPGAVG